jgi:hypothetical protein
MKVLSLLEFVNLDRETTFPTPYEKQAYLVGIGLMTKEEIRGLSELTLILIYKDFTKQPFTPELITKYFKGWRTELVDKPSGYYKHYHDEYHLIDTDILNDKIWLDSPITGTIYYMRLPKTLDRFICHCQDADIELEWKEVANERD